MEEGERGVLHGGKSDGGGRGKIKRLKINKIESLWAGRRGTNGFHGIYNKFKEKRGKGRVVRS